MSIEAIIFYLNWNKHTNNKIIGNLIRKFLYNKYIIIHKYNAHIYVFAERTLNAKVDQYLMNISLFTIALNEGIREEKKQDEEKKIENYVYAWVRKYKLE